MENGSFAPPQEQMFHFALYFQKSYISKASKDACTELWVKGKYHIFRRFCVRYELNLEADQAFISASK